MKRVYCIISVIVFSFYGSSVLAQTSGADSIYFANYVYHQDGTPCKHLPPATGYVMYLNRDLSRIILENAPRWKSGTDPTIDGKGGFGAELGTFRNPGVTANDSVFALFVCTQTQQQGRFGSSLSGLPYAPFPKSVTMNSVAMPMPPTDLMLRSDSSGRRTLTWSSAAGASYTVYRRNIRDTLGAFPSKMYIRLADTVTTGAFTDSTAESLERYGYILLPKSAAGVMGLHSAEVNEAPVIRAGNDLVVGWIARLPRINYDWAASDPQLDGWPTPAQLVSWQAVVRNWFSDTLRNVKYRWSVNHVPVDSGAITLPAGSTTTVSYVWPWTFARHEVTFLIDADNAIPEEEEGNNEVTVFTNAIAAGFYVEQSVYDYFRQYQKQLNVHSNCWEDWAQRHVRRWNQMFAGAVYAESPQGVLDRVRLDNVTVVPDGALPLVPGWLPTNAPNANDRTVDLQWGFTAEGVQGNFYANHTSATDNNPFYFEGSLLHELGHARYLIDVYGFNVHDDGTGSTLGIRVNGVLAVTSGLLPSNYFTPIQGLMNGQYTYVDRYSAAAMNLIAGHRAVMGNYNAPGNIGVFMNDLPAENRVHLVDGDGVPIRNALVKVYQAAGKSGEWYGKYFDDIPDIVVTSDSMGIVLLGRCPFSQTGSIEHTYGHSNAVIVLRVECGGLVGFAFLESMWFNLQYWMGRTAQGDYNVTIPLSIPPTGVAETADLPKEFLLEQNFPNPFNPSTTIPYQLPSAVHVRVAIYDALGREVALLIDRDQEPGAYRTTWDAAGSASGIYFVRLTAGVHVSSRKLVLLK